jgi:hypothetical protein
MRRIEVLDGLRGAALVFMLITHLQFGGAFALKWLHFGNFGFVSSAQFFIFLSGLLVGLIYRKSLDRHGPSTVTRRLWKRAAELYGWHLAILVIVLFAVRLFEGSYAAWARHLGALLYGDSVGYTVASAALLYQPGFMDILPQYMLYLLASPALVMLVARGRALPVMIGSLLLWLSVQLGLHLPLVAALEWLAGDLGPDLTTRSAFNPLAWQILYVSGLVAGALVAGGQVNGRDLLGGSFSSVLIRTAVAITGFFLLWRLSFTFAVIPEQMAERFQLLENRQEFGLVYLLGFAAFGYIVAWLLIEGRNSLLPVVRQAGAALHRLFGNPFLALLGRNSLPVFAYHVLLVYALKLIDWYWGPVGDPLSSCLGVLAIASLALPALVLEGRLPVLLKRSPATAAN